MLFEAQTPWRLSLHDAPRGLNLGNIPIHTQIPSDAQPPPPTRPPPRTKLHSTTAKNAVMEPHYTSQPHLSSSYMHTVPEHNPFSTNTTAHFHSVFHTYSLNLGV